MSLITVMCIIMMASLHTNPVTFADNAANNYSAMLAFRSTICNHGRTIPPQMGMGFSSQAMQTFTSNSVIRMRHQMDESNRDIVNTLTQQMSTIYNPLIQNTNKSYQ